MKQFLIVTALALLLFTSTPSKAYAVFTDPVQAIKELGSDLWAWSSGGRLIGRLVRKTTEWVNTGFTVTARVAVYDPVTGELHITKTTGSGDPTFIANPNEFFKGVTVDSAATFYDQLREAESDPDQALNVIFPGFKDDLLKEVARSTQGMSGTFFDNFESDLEETELDAYLDDFTTGGWEMFLRTTQNCANNYSCARLAVLSELDSRVTGAVTEKQTELDQGAGFLTIRTCVEESDTEPGGCLKYKDVTPGRIIADQMTRAAGADLDRRLQVDETSERLATLFEDAINKLIGNGLSSLWDTFSNEAYYEGEWKRVIDDAKREEDRLKQEMEDKQSEMDDEKGEFRDALEVESGGSGSKPKDYDDWSDEDKAAYDMMIRMFQGDEQTRKAALDMLRKLFGQY